MNQHCTDEIYADHSTLSAAAAEHVRHCTSCARHLAMVARIADGVSSLPSAPQPVPERLRMRVMMRIRGPLYRVWHILAAGLLVLLSPLFIQRLAVNYGQLGGDLKALLYGMYGLLMLLLLLPLTHRLLDTFNQDVHDLERTVDDLLEHNPLRTLGGAIRKRVGF